MIALHCATRISWLKQLLSHVDLDTRESVARLLGIACSALSSPTLSDLICELLSLISRTNNLRFVVHGNMFLILCFILSYLAVTIQFLILGLNQHIFQV